MTLPVFVVDANVIVSALIGSDSKAPPARILEAMLDGSLLYLMSGDLLAEYASVLRRPRLVRLHGRSEEEIDRLLVELTGNAIWREAPAGDTAPDANDNHLWALLASWAGSRLVTGDRGLVEGASAGRLALSPRDFVNLHKSR
ncbi:MAG: putative toxin-antitoxin system toxin component, PIN family [Gemmatimonadota bacterium]|nr:putative toxin-antitoxin system toxin component, PIN family [Gemmatimonadota bacterium]